MARRLARPAIVLAALGTLAVALSPARSQAPGAGERVCGGGSAAVVRDGRWTLVRKPEALERITAHAAGGENGRLLLAGDGRTVVRSADGGCTWEPSYAVETPDVDGVLPKVERLLIPEGDSAGFMVLSGVGRAAVSQILRSADGGRTWAAVDGLPAAFAVRELVAAPDDPSRLFATLALNDVAGDNDPAGGSGVLYASEDGGKTWAERSRGAQIEELAVDNTEATRLWAVRANGAAERSMDGGRTWTRLEMPAAVDADANDQLPAGVDRWRDVTVFTQRPQLPVVAFAASPTRQADITRVVVSVDAGATFFDIELDGLGPASGMEFANSPGQLFATAGTTTNSAFRGPGLLQFDTYEQRWLDIDELGLGSMVDPHVVRTPNGSSPRFRGLYMRRTLPDPSGPGDEDLIVRYDPPAPPEGPLSVLGRYPCGKQGPPKPADVRRPRIGFEPGSLDIELEPGKPAKLPLKARVPAAPSPIDVYFLVDSSSSMDPAIEGLFCSIRRLVRDLPEKGVDVWFGLGSYNDVQQDTYRRLVDVSPPSLAIHEAFRRLFTRQGVDEPIRGALYQTATGAGLDVEALNPESGVFAGSRIPRKVTPGQQANFRDDVYRMVLLVGDEPYEEDTDGEPPVTQVYEALRAKDIHTVGLRVIPPLREQVQQPALTNGGEPETESEHSPLRLARLQRQMQGFARETKTIAPRGGIDCDGGGTPDLPAGEPVVCDINEAGIKEEIDDTIVSILASLEDVQDIELRPSKRSELPTQVDGKPLEKANVKKVNVLEGTGVVSCSEDQAGRTFDIGFDVVIGGRVRGGIDGRAVCGAKPAVVPPVKPPRAAKAKPKPAPDARPAAKPAAPVAPKPAAPAPQVQAPQPAAAAAPPPPPPAPAPVTPAPAQAPAGAQAAAAQPGAAAQEHREVSAKVATVTTSDGGERVPGGEYAMGAEARGGREYAMSRIDRGGAPWPGAAARPGASREHAMVANRGARSAVPLEAVVTLGIGLCGLLVFVGVASAPRQRRPSAIEPATVTVTAASARRARGR